MRKTTWNTSSTQKKKQRHPYKSAVLLMAMGLLLSGNMPAKAAVTQEDLANPVMDESTHNMECTYESGYGKYGFAHSTRYHYVYFGNYPQREIKGEELTDRIINAAYDRYGNAEIDGKKYRRISYEMTTIYKSLNGTDFKENLFAQQSTNGYRYYLYEPIKWKIYKNSDGTLFLVSDRMVEAQIYDRTHDGQWADCDLRKWLNYDGGEPQVEVGYDKAYQYRYPGFLYYAFSEEEKSRIQTTHVVQDNNPGKLNDGTYASSGPDTEDKIFILNYTEASSHEYGVCYNNDQGCEALNLRNTDYSRALTPDDYRGYNIKMHRGEHWLRTIGQYDGVKKPGEAMYVSSGHVCSGVSVKWECVYVVPALNAGYTLDDCIRVSFATGTDTKVEDQILLGSNYAREPVTTAVTGAETKLVLKKEGYEFTGWYLDEACTKPYSFNRKLTQDTTLYAGWKKCQAAPAGLKGGVMKIEGTTSAMEYAASKDGSGGWTDCQEGTTVVPSAGTWYVRYKETTECFAGEAAEVTVITAEEAVAAYIREHNIPQATAAITQETIENTSGEKDMEGSTFSILQAKTGKVTSKSIGLKWKAVEEADGYEIYGNKCGKKNKYRLIKTVSGGKSTSFTQKKLKKGTYYKYIVRAYKEVEGKKVSLAVSKTIHVTTTGGKYGNAKSVKIKTDKKLKKKKGTYTVELKKNKKYSLKASETKQNKKIKKHRATAYESGDTGIATVTSKGVIVGKQKGTCYIYVYAQNGMCQKIKVKVN